MIYLVDTAGPDGFTFVQHGNPVRDSASGRHIVADGQGGSAQVSDAFGNQIVDHIAHDRI